MAIYRSLLMAFLLERRQGFFLENCSLPFARMMPNRLTIVRIESSLWLGGKLRGTLLS